MVVERGLDPVLGKARDEAAGSSDDAAQRAAGHQPRGDHYAALAHGSAARAAQFFRTLAQEVGEKTSHQGRAVELERQIHPQREDQRRHAEHLHDHGNRGPSAEENIGHRLAAHESFHQGFHDGRLRGRQHHARVARSRFTELKRVRQHYNRQPNRYRCGDHAQELELLLRRRRRAQPVAGFEIGDGLPGDR